MKAPRVLGAGTLPREAPQADSRQLASWQAPGRRLQPAEQGLPSTAGLGVAEGCGTAASGPGAARAASSSSSTTLRAEKEFVRGTSALRAFSEPFRMGP